MNVKLAKLIVEKGYLSLDNLKTAVEEQKSTDKSLGIILIDHGFITENQLLDTTNIENEFEVIDLFAIDIPENVIKLVSKEIAIENNLIPFDLNGSFLSVAMLDPSNILVIDELRFLTGYNVRPFITLYSGIKYALGKYYNVELDKEVKPEKIDINKISESKSDDLPIGSIGIDEKFKVSAGEPQKDSTGIDAVKPDFTVSEDIKEQIRVDVKDTDSSVQHGVSSGKSVESLEDLMPKDVPSPAENQKHLDKIDIFNLSPDEIEESKSYKSKHLTDNLQSSPADLNLHAFQSPVNAKTDVLSTPLKDISTDSNTESLFQAPSSVIKSAESSDNNLFQAAPRENAVGFNESENLFKAPEKGFPEKEGLPQKEFGIPFVFKADEQDLRFEVDSKSGDFTTQSPQSELQIDPFTAYSGDRNKSAEPSMNTAPPSFVMEESDFKSKKDSTYNIELPETRDDNVAPDLSKNDQDQFRVQLSPEVDESGQQLSKGSTGGMNQKTDSQEMNNPFANLELESINVDTSYDNIESLSTGNELRNPQPASEEKYDLRSSENNGNYVDAKSENETILKLEDDSLEKDEDIVRPTVLVVDDSPTVQKIVSATLNRRGYNVEVSSNALQALAKLNDCIPDIIFLDINLPHMDGYQLCKVIKSNELTKTIPVVMLSGKDSFFDKWRGKMVGATGYITKPFEPNTLVSAIEKQGITVARTN